MNIDFVTTGTLPFPPVNGGAVEMLLGELVQYNEIRREHQITVYSIYATAAEKEAQKLRCCTVKYISINRSWLLLSRYFYHAVNLFPRLYFGNAYLHRLTRMLRREPQCDLLVVENPCRFGVALKKACAVPMVLHLHNDYLNIAPAYAAKMLSPYDKVIAISGFIRRRVLTVDATRNAVTVYNGIDLERFDRSQVPIFAVEHLRREYGILPDDIVFAFAGRLSPEKGVAELIEAFRTVARKFPVKLVIIGSSLYRGAPATTYIHRLRKMASLCKDRIVFTGYIPQSRMPETYAVADVGVVPSIWEEPFGLTLMEQMAIGLPIITTDSGAIPELISKDSAILVKRDKNLVSSLEDAMLRLAADGELRKRMGAQARREAQKFSKEEFCKNFYNSIASIVSQENAQCKKC